MRARDSSDCTQEWANKCSKNPSEIIPRFYRSISAVSCISILWLVSSYRSIEIVSTFEAPQVRLKASFFHTSMAGCLDNVQLPNLEVLQIGEKRNKVAAITAGVLVKFKTTFTSRFELSDRLCFSSSQGGGWQSTLRSTTRIRQTSRTSFTSAASLGPYPCSCESSQSTRMSSA